jgi:hypothetical protein
MTIPAPGFGGGDGSEEARKREAAPFAITGGRAFLPQYFPETIRVRRQRNLDRSQNFCKGEDVTDNGAKNREIHITGKLVGLEKNSFDRLVDYDGPVDMTSATWSGEVRVKEGEYEGPTGWDPQSGFYYYDYTLDLVSTGAGLRDRAEGNGIISDGSDVDESDTTGLTQ